MVGLGTLINKGKLQYLKQLRQFASDSRWRIREAVALALQRIGDENIEFLLKETTEWSKGNHYEKRAALAALCEPRLLISEKVAATTLYILDQVTASFSTSQNTKSEDFEALKKGLAYAGASPKQLTLKKGKS